MDCVERSVFLGFSQKKLRRGYKVPLKPPEAEGGLLEGTCGRCGYPGDR
jgi:hypothetical protein